MSDTSVLERIADWEAAGLIDAVTAARLRAAESSAPAGRIQSMATSAFGPAPQITEVFGYLGGAFVLGAWHSLVSSILPREICDELAGCRNDIARDVVQWLVGAAWLAVLGFLLARRGDRGGRAAGVAYLVATAHVLVGVQLLFARNPAFDATETLLAGAAGTAAAVVFRRIQPALLTQLGLLIAAVVLAFGTMELLAKVLFPGDPFGEAGATRPLLAIAWWILVATVLGLAARWEQHRHVGGVADDRNSADRRAGMTRLAAGLTAVIGTSLGALGGFYGRPFEPWQDDVIVAAVSAVLLGLAVRYGAAAYLYPAALGLFIAFSDLNAQYIAAETGTGIALLVEGVILLAVGVGADQLRRRLELRASGRSTGIGPEPPREAEAAT